MTGSMGKISLPRQSLCNNKRNTTAKPNRASLPAGRMDAPIPLPAGIEGMRAVIVERLRYASKIREVRLL